MPTTLIPAVYAEATYVPLAYGAVIAPPVWWWSVAADWNAESGSSIEGGRFSKGKSEVISVPKPYFQDTYLFGTGSRTGRAFDLTTGICKDDWVAPWSNKYGLLFPDSSAAATFDVAMHDTFDTGLHHELVIVRRGIPPIESAPTAANCYAYLELAHGNKQNYRVAMEYGQPIRLDYSHEDETDGEWRQVAICRDLPDAETYLAQNSREVRIQIRPDKDLGIFEVEIGEGHVLRHTPDRSNPAARGNVVVGLPDKQRYRLVGKNGWASMEVYPYRYSEVTVRKSKRYIGRVVDEDKALFLYNQGGASAANQTTETQLEQDGNGNLSWTTVASTPDVGDESGAEVPAKLTDVIVYIPSRFERWSGPLAIPEAVLGATRVEERMYWDDNLRFGYMNGTIYVQNAYGTYTGAFGNYALNIIASNGYFAGQRCRGVMGIGRDGWRLDRMDPHSIVAIPFSDKSEMMKSALCTELILDGLALPTAVRLLAEHGNIAPEYLVGIPDVGFPPYPDDFPYYILGKGTGMTPKYRYMPERSALSVLLDVIQDSGQDNGPHRSATPYYMFFDVYGDFHFEPYDPTQQPIVRGFSSADPTGAGQIFNLSVHNSVDDMRTEVTVQGQDAFTYELLQWFQGLPENLFTVGWRRPALERNARYASQAYVANIARVLATQASLGTQIVMMRVPFDPSLTAGQVIAIADELTIGGAGLYTIIGMESEYGLATPDGFSGEHACYSWITARSLVNSLVL